MNSYFLVEDERTIGERHQPAANVFYIEIVPYGQAVRRILLEPGRFVVGRSAAQALVVLSDPRVSRVHLRVSRDLNLGVRLTDLYSANGTFLDGRRLPSGVPFMWLIDQTVAIGSSRLILHYGAFKP